MFLNIWPMQVSCQQSNFPIFILRCIFHVSRYKLQFNYFVYRRSNRPFVLSNTFSGLSKWRRKIPQLPLFFVFPALCFMYIRIHFVLSIQIYIAAIMLWLLLVMAKVCENVWVLRVGFSHRDLSRISANFTVWPSSSLTSSRPFRNRAAWNLFVALGHKSKEKITSAETTNYNDLF